MKIMTERQEVTEFLFLNGLHGLASNAGPALTCSAERGAFSGLEIGLELRETA
jgi:hypothetical protein